VDQNWLEYLLNIRRSPILSPRQSWESLRGSGFRIAELLVLEDGETFAVLRSIKNSLGNHDQTPLTNAQLCPHRRYLDQDMDRTLRSLYRDLTAPVQTLIAQGLTSNTLEAWFDQLVRILDAILTHKPELEASILAYLEVL